MRKPLCLALCALLWVTAACAKEPQAAPVAPVVTGPQVDLLVELRQVDDGSAGYSVSTRAQAPVLQPQQVRVRSGSKATLSLSQSQPVQWVKSVSTQDASLSTGAVTASGQSRGVTQELVWLEANQTLVVLPHWAGDKKPVRLDVEVQQAQVDERVGTALPSQRKSQLVTSVSAALGQWVTIASTGSAPARGTYSSDAQDTSRQLIQLRVSRP